MKKRIISLVIIATMVIAISGISMASTGFRVTARTFDSAGNMTAHFALNTRATIAGAHGSIEKK